MLPKKLYIFHKFIKEDRDIREEHIIDKNYHRVKVICMEKHQINYFSDKKAESLMWFSNVKPEYLSKKYIVYIANLIK